MSQKIWVVETFESPEDGGDGWLPLDPAPWFWTQRSAAEHPVTTEPSRVSCYKRTDSAQDVRFRELLYAAVDNLKEMDERCKSLQADLDFAKEGLRGIAKMDPKTEADRMVLWAKDTLSGRATAFNPGANP